jgi:energy-coupling factor transporter ATP-binding protein EcfA2
MAQREFFAGPNFSGRSAALIALLRSRALGAPSFFIGPYAEAALSGLTSSIADEILLYRAQPRRLRPPFDRMGLSKLEKRKPQSLSGGEQVLLALHCFSLSSYDTLAIDTALEQLDGDNRAAAFDYLETGAFNAALIDNRANPLGWHVNTRTPERPLYQINWPALGAAILPQQATEIVVRDLNFRYPNGKTIFRHAVAQLWPGRPLRLAGANGSGKTTLLKILVGALAPQSGQIWLGSRLYAPWRRGNRALALATQNPDQQWCGATLREDMTRRRKALDGERAATALAEPRLTELARLFGLASLDQHLYELPLAARKRASWLWPFAGAHPWIMLDEPTLGQDRDTRENLARTLTRICKLGYGVIFVTHDEDFANLLPHGVIRIDRGTISSP